jgi:hypothetical protein
MQPPKPQEPTPQQRADTILAEWQKKKHLPPADRLKEWDEFERDMKVLSFLLQK